MTAVDFNYPYNYFFVRKNLFNYNVIMNVLKVRACHVKQHIVHLLKTANKQPLQIGNPISHVALLLSERKLLLPNTNVWICRNELMPWMCFTVQITSTCTMFGFGMAKDKDI